MKENGCDPGKKLHERRLNLTMGFYENVLRIIMLVWLEGRLSVLTCHYAIRSRGERRRLRKRKRLA